jgi:hypothetical protein
MEWPILSWDAACIGTTDLVSATGIFESLVEFLILFWKGSVWQCQVDRDTGGLVASNRVSCYNTSTKVMQLRPERTGPYSTRTGPYSTRSLNQNAQMSKSHFCVNVHVVNMKPKATAQLLSIPSYFVFDRSRARILACRLVIVGFRGLPHSLHKNSRIIYPQKLGLRHVYKW